MPKMILAIMSDEVEDVDAEEPEVRRRTEVEELAKEVFRLE